MPDKDDPYSILGVSPAADIHQVRRAYRQKALRYHPDNRRGDPAAEHEFRRLHLAYRQVLRSALRQGRSSSTQPPRSHNATAWRPAHGLVACRPEALGDERYVRNLPGARKLALASVNEPVIFMSLWILAVIVSVALPCVIAATSLADLFTYGPAGTKILVLIALCLGTYAAVLGCALLTIFLSRKTLWLLAQFTFRGLPTPRSPR